MIFLVIFGIGLVLQICNGQNGQNNNQWAVGKSYSSTNPVTRYAWTRTTQLQREHEGLLEESIRLPGGGMTGAPEVVSLNMLMIRAIQGKKALDVGLFAGFSAMGSALAVPSDGTVVGMDISDQAWNQIGRRRAEAAGILNKIDVRIAPAKNTMDQLIRQGQSGTYDFCFIDADKTGYDTYYEQCLTLLRPRGVITIDNTLWGGSVLNANENDKTSSTGAINTLNMKIANDTRVWAELLTIGDGLMVIVKK